MRPSKAFFSFSYSVYGFFLYDSPVRTINFLNPVKAADLIAESKIIRQGKRLVYLETYLYSEGTEKPVAHITSTYAVRIEKNRYRKIKVNFSS